ncbi:2-amino-4-hydroxy-6-hydroxymethyldihydropteridine pyrophosphokinase [Novosphingobium aromaticivorans DSM 12444]|uniref:2-amino-4-hydroxy-6-hydroxymethyldihydropteridine pyrophosphokinase n=2 Tax=Novosphingobium aromaticivorans TaxID=48935 RepID=Q2G3P6_NOVAD|nr:2-amino-4-hydroxy-6-hydroxymethyldihydropteridine pyrophosphokinase [Novosphingobium aromaticivorans DSM 12444]
MNRYLIALGSNQRHPRHGLPSMILRAAVDELRGEGVLVEAVSPTLRSRPLGPSLREYANGAAVISTHLDPPELLELLQQVERRFGRRRQGQRWRSRTLDLDVVLWSGGFWADEALVIPHREFRKRDFVLAPAAKIAPDWRDPLTGLTIRHLAARLARPLTRRPPHPR